MKSETYSVLWMGYKEAIEKMERRASALKNEGGRVVSVVWVEKADEFILFYEERL